MDVFDFSIIMGIRVNIIIKGIPSDYSECR
jgi:hypothetical protein